MTKNRKGSHYSHPTSKSKDTTFVYLNQNAGEINIDFKDNPRLFIYLQAMKRVNELLPTFDRNIIFSLQKEPKPIRKLSEEFSIDLATIRRTLRRLIRYGFVAEVWHGKDTKTNRDTSYYSSDLETVRFCQLRKEASNG